MWWTVAALAAPGVKVGAIEGEEPWPAAQKAALTSAVQRCVTKPWWGVLEVRVMTTDKLEASVSDPDFADEPAGCVKAAVEKALAGQDLYAAAYVVVTADPAWLATVTVTGAPAGLGDAVRDRFVKCNAGKPIEATFPVTLAVQTASGYDKPVVSIRAYDALPASTEASDLGRCAGQRFIEDAAGQKVGEYKAVVKVVTAKAKRGAVAVTPVGDAPAPALAVARDLAELCTGLAPVAGPFQLAVSVHGDSRSVMTMASGAAEKVPTGSVHDCLTSSALPGLPDGDWTVRVTPR